jgi:hypothetical protein
MSVSLIARGLTLGALVFGLTGCQAVTGLFGDLTGQNTDQPSGVVAEDPTTADTPAEAPAEPAEEEAAAPVADQGPVPTCDTIYSDAQVVAFSEEGRVSEGDISADGYGYGTTNQDLVAILADARKDLRISCTWYLPPEFSSTTSMAILSSANMAAVETILGEAADSSTTLGGGSLWKFDASSSNISGEFIANEAHFITPTPCPESLAETDCSLWVASTNSAGSSEELTRDAATTFGALN